MTVIILSESLSKGISLFSHLPDKITNNTYIFIANNHFSGFLFLLRLFFDFTRLSFSLQKLVFKLFFKKKIKLSLIPAESSKNILWLRKIKPDIGLHAMGIIYSRNLIEIFQKGILNAHIGLLPMYRGRSVFEWSLLHGKDVGVTTFFIDEGIDTGAPIVLIKPININKMNSIKRAKNYLFSLDGEMYGEALKKLLREDCEVYANNLNEGRRYYVNV